MRTTLADLWRVHDLARVRFPHDYLDAGLGAVGLFLHERPAHAGYRQTPRNSVSFASVGVDGIHFGSLTDGDDVDPDAPVVATMPMSFERPNHIVGESLHDFLCLGLHCGYEAIVDLPERPQETLEVLATRPAEWFDDRVPGILALLATELSLAPWSQMHKHFDELQHRFLGSLHLDD